MPTASIHVKLLVVNGRVHFVRVLAPVPPKDEPQHQYLRGHGRYYELGWSSMQEQIFTKLDNL